MRRKDRNISDHGMMCDIIRENNVAVVSMIDGDMPYGVMMNYAPRFDGDSISLIFHCSRSGRKFDCLSKRPEVSVFINDSKNTRIVDAGKAASQWTTHYRSVILTGKIRFVEDLEEKRHAAEAFMSHYTEGAVDLPETALKAVLFMELACETIRGKQNPMER